MICCYYFSESSAPEMLHFEPQPIKAGVIVVPCAVRVVAVVAGIKLVGVPQPKPLYEFLPNFQDMFTPRGSRAD